MGSIVAEELLTIIDNTSFEQNLHKFFLDLIPFLQDRALITDIDIRTCIVYLIEESKYTSGFILITLLENTDYAEIFMASEQKILSKINFYEYVDRAIDILSQSGNTEKVKFLEKFTADRGPIFRRKKPKKTD